MSSKTKSGIPEQPLAESRDIAIPHGRQPEVLHSTPRPSCSNLYCFKLVAHENPSLAAQGFLASKKFESHSKNIWLQTSHFSSKHFRYQCRFKNFPNNFSNSIRHHRSRVGVAAVIPGIWHVQPCCYSVSYRRSSRCVQIHWLRVFLTAKTKEKHKYRDLFPWMKFHPQDAQPFSISPVMQCFWRIQVVTTHSPLLSSFFERRKWFPYSARWYQWQVGVSFSGHGAARKRRCTLWNSFKRWLGDVCVCLVLNRVNSHVRQEQDVWFSLPDNEEMYDRIRYCSSLPHFLLSELCTKCVCVIWIDSGRTKPIPRRAAAAKSDTSDLESNKCLVRATTGRKKTISTIVRWAVCEVDAGWSRFDEKLFL